MPRSLKLSVLFTGLLVLIIDQITKFVIIKKIPADGIFFIKTHPLTFGFLPTLNPFIAFGLKLPTVLIFLLFVIIVLLILYLARKSYLANDPGATSLLVLIIAAAFSNFIDRLIHSGVVDFISLTIYGFSWATFNLADALIVIAIIILVIKTPKKYYEKNTIYYYTCLVALSMAAYQGRGDNARSFYFHGKRLPLLRQSARTPRGVEKNLPRSENQ